MSKRLLLSAPIGCPGALSALRNHEAVLKSSIDVDFVPLEPLIFPHFKDFTKFRNFYFRISRRIKVVSIDKIIPYENNIIFASFGPIYETVIKKLNKKGIRPSFIWCSSLGQLELTPGERKTFKHLIDFFKQGRIKNLLLHRRLYNSIGRFISGTTYFPHSIDLLSYKNVMKKEIPGTNIDLFCKPRLGKNILNQVLAFKIAEVDGFLHINFDVGKFHGIIKTISSQIVKHKWLPIEDYYSLISSMTISLQVTIGESFNYAVCERMALKVPPLTTSDIYLVSEDSFLAKYLCVSAADTPLEIAKPIRKIVNDQKLRAELAEKCKERISEVAKVNNKIVIDQFNTIFS